MSRKPLERSEYIGMKVTPEEKKTIFAAAASAGLTVTAYLVGSAIGDYLGDKIVEKMDANSNLSER